MKKGYAVIGMNYGDEGKGHITNYFSDMQTLNVRFNGGGQAAHGVYLSNGMNHVFHHFGAGSMRGARTLLARKFIVHPMLFLKELNELLDKKVNMREVFIDPSCIVTTFYDVMLNLYTLKLKKSTGTCGLGINETVERSGYDQLKLTVRQLKEFSKDHLIKKIKQIENEWLPYRLDELGYDANDFKSYGTSFMASDIEGKFIDCCKWLIDHSVVWKDSDLIDRYLAKEEDRKVVFEGAQGKLLDQRRKEFFPHLTRSNTGFRNIAYIMKEMKTELDLDAYLVTRSYLTRHGEGPIFNPVNAAYNSVDSDPTNPENEGQGKMRFGYIKPSWYDKAIEEIEDILTTRKIKAQVKVAMTCMDQTGNEYDGLNSTIRVKEDNETLIQVGHLPKISLLSNGNTEKDIHDVDK